MMKQGELLRIGELAKEAGVSLTTVKFYAKEGLIRPARKTGRNMAYYDRACVNTIGTIRRLQRERYYPLSVIKRLMESAPVEQVELELLDAIHKADRARPGRARAAFRGRAPQRADGPADRPADGERRPRPRARRPQKALHRRRSRRDGAGKAPSGRGHPLRTDRALVFDLRKGPARGRVAPKWTTLPPGR